MREDGPATAVNAAILRLALALVVLSPTLYSAKLFLSPVYFFCGLGLLLGSVYLACAGKFVLNGSIFAASALLIYVLLSGAGVINGALTNIVFGLVAFIFIAGFGGQVEKAYLLKLVRLSIWISAILLSMDTVWRFTHPAVPTEEQLAAYEERDTVFYLFKFSSLMFADSNTVGLAALQYIFLLLFIRKIDARPRDKILIILLVAVVGFTFSRASVAALGVGLIFIYLKTVRSTMAWVAIAGMAAVAGGYLASLLIKEDLSFQSKFDILGRVIAFFSLPGHWLDKLFGIGLDQSIGVLGIAAHNIFLTYFLELGIVGLMLFFVFLVTLMRGSRNVLYYGLIPPLVAGLSYYFYAGSPFLFVPLALIGLMDKGGVMKGRAGLVNHSPIAKL